MERAAAVRAPSVGASDERGFEQVYRRHVGFVWRSLRSLGVPESMLEDAAHEVFLVVHRRWADFDGRAKMTTWLFGIAQGVARNHRRGHLRAERRLAAVRDASTHAAADSGVHAHPGRHLDRKQAAALVESFLGTLDEDKRRVFELCEIEGMSAPEAARCLAINVNTVSTRLRRARASFARWVQALGEGTR